MASLKGTMAVIHLARTNRLFLSGSEITPIYFIHTEIYTRKKSPCKIRTKYTFNQSEKQATVKIHRSFVQSETRR